jgi:hypothetical protein
MLLLAFLLAFLHGVSVPATGTYSYTLVPDSSDDVKGVVNHTVEHMSFITRPTARNRLNRLNPVPQHVQVTVTPDSLRVEFEGLNPIVTPMDGTEVPWRSSINNDDYRIHAMVQGDTVFQVISAKDGMRTNAYLFGDGTTHLAMHVTLESHRLPQPLEYTLVYRQDSTEQQQAQQ